MIMAVDYAFRVYHWLLMPFLAKINQWKSIYFVYVMCWSFNMCTCYELNQWKSFAFEDWKPLVYVLCTSICICGHHCQALTICNSSHATNMILSQKKKHNKKSCQINITNKVAKNTHFHLHLCSSLSGSYINEFQFLWNLNQNQNMLNFTSIWVDKFLWNLNQNQTIWVPVPMELSQKNQYKSRFIHKQFLIKKVQVSWLAFFICSFFFCNCLVVILGAPFQCKPGGW